MPRDLPKWMHQKHGGYYFVRRNKWTFLSRDLRTALRLYADKATSSHSGAMSELIDTALADMKTTTAASTYKNYAICADRARVSLCHLHPTEVRPKHIAEFMDTSKDKPSMANLMRSFIKGVFERGARWGMCDVNPAREIKPFKTKARERYITESEYAEIKANASPTMQCLMDLAYITGQRIGDVMKIRYSDISKDGVFVKQQKTGNRVFVAMTKDLADAIQQAKDMHTSVRGLTLFHKPDGSQLSYTTMYGHWKRACEAAKVEDAHFHDIRAASATDANDAGMDSKTLLGHTTESSHNRYLRSKKIPVAQPVPARKQKPGI